jgi:hypothetical protein
MRMSWHLFPDAAVISGSLETQRLSGRLPIYSWAQHSEPQHRPLTEAIQSYQSTCIARFPVSKSLRAFDEEYPQRRFSNYRGECRCILEDLGTGDNDRIRWTIPQFPSKLASDGPSLGQLVGLDRKSRRRAQIGRPIANEFVAQPRNFSGCRRNWHPDGPCVLGRILTVRSCNNSRSSMAGI